MMPAPPLLHALLLGLAAGATLRLPPEGIGEPEALKEDEGGANLTRRLATSLSRSGPEEGPGSGQAGGLRPPPFRVALLTSLFAGKEPGGHMEELLLALLANLVNPHIEAAHVLLESDGGGTCDSLLRIAKKKVRDRRVLAVGPRDFAKITCVVVERQPTYADFFGYANTHLRSKNVLLANTDVVFDATLGQVEPKALASGRLVYVISVVPPPINGAYKRVFGHECALPSRCTLGLFNNGGDHQHSPGASWDAYLFRSPLPQTLDLSGLDIPMNAVGAENHAGYELEAKAGLQLHNPCMHVTAAHWHCRGAKMHSPMDLVAHTRKLKDVLPCWDCPGVSVAAGEAQAKDMCKAGHIRDSHHPALKGLLGPQNGKYARTGYFDVCCGLKDQECQWNVAEAGRVCRRSRDVSCVIARTEGWQHQVY